MAGGEVGQAEFNRMVDRFMEAGFCYFGLLLDVWPQ